MTWRELPHTNSLPSLRRREVVIKRPANHVDFLRESVVLVSGS